MLPTSASRQITPFLDDIPTEIIQVSPESRIMVHIDPRGPFADRFRFLRMRLRELWDAKKLKSLLITSPLPHDGKSTTALNLATVLAEHGKRSVLLIEGDLHHPSLTGTLGLEPRPGFAECLTTHVDPLSVIHRIEPLGWYLMSAGNSGGNPTELLQSGAIVELMQTLALHFDWIVIDAPPVTPLADALLLRQRVDATLLVAMAGRTPTQAVEEAMTLIGRKHILGLILNGVEGMDTIYSKYYGSAGVKASGQNGKGAA